MASPIGHAAVGTALAAIVARATGTPPTPALWVGAVVSSGLPDLDVLLPLLGFPRRSHRGASHSLFIIALVIAVCYAVARNTGAGVRTGDLLAWTAALVSHPLLDVITTGPRLGAIGWGIPLLWPFTSRRFWVTWPLLGDREEALTLADHLKEMQDDLLKMVPVCALTTVIALLWR